MKHALFFIHSNHPALISHISIREEIHCVPPLGDEKCIKLIVANCILFYSAKGLLRLFGASKFIMESKTKSTKFTRFGHCTAQKIGENMVNTVILTIYGPFYRIGNGLEKNVFFQKKKCMYAIV